MTHSMTLSEFFAQPVFDVVRVGIDGRTSHIGTAYGFDGALVLAMDWVCGPSRQGWFDRTVSTIDVRCRSGEVRASLVAEICNEVL